MVDTLEGKKKLVQSQQLVTLCDNVTITSKNSSEITLNGLHYIKYNVELLKGLTTKSKIKEEEEEQFCEMSKVDSGKISKPLHDFFSSICQSTLINYIGLIYH